MFLQQTNFSPGSYTVSVVSFMLRLASGVEITTSAHHKQQTHGDQLLHLGVFSGLFNFPVIMDCTI